MKPRFELHHTIILGLARYNAKQYFVQVTVLYFLCIISGCFHHRVSVVSYGRKINWKEFGGSSICTIEVLTYT
jgi:hypothetical protein